MNYNFLALHVLITKLYGLKGGRFDEGGNGGRGAHVK